MKISDKVINNQTQQVFTIGNIIVKNDFLPEDIYVLVDNKKKSMQVYGSTFFENFTKK